MGGRVAEEMVFGAENVTSGMAFVCMPLVCNATLTHHSNVGASSDVEAASRLARTMITKYAMSDVVSPTITLRNVVCHPDPL